MSNSMIDMQQKVACYRNILTKLAMLPMEMWGIELDILERLTGANGEAWARNIARTLNHGLTREAVATPAQKPAEVAIFTPDLVAPQLARWTTLYRKHFGIVLDPVNLRIPAHKPGFGRLLVVAQGLTANKVYDVCARLFPCSRVSDDFDMEVPTYERDPKNDAYTIWVRDAGEVDKETRNLSAEDLSTQKLTTLTLLERLLFELDYVEQTREHLDLESVTLCSGSRDSDGLVPGAGWNDDELYVNWYDVNRRHNDLGARVAVS